MNDCEINVGLTNEHQCFGKCAIDEITPREREVLTYLSKGKSYKDISHNLCISENTVKYHVKTLLRKSGYKNSLQLVANSVLSGLIDLSDAEDREEHI